MAKTKTKIRRVYVKAKRRSRRANTGVSLAVVGGFVPLVGYTIDGFNRGGSNMTDKLRNGLRYLSMATTGYDFVDKKWYPGEVWKGTVPVLAGVLVHRLASKFGVNRSIARAGIPFVRI